MRNSLFPLIIYRHFIPKLAAIGFVVDTFKTNVLFCINFPGVNKI